MLKQELREIQYHIVIPNTRIKMESWFQYVEVSSENLIRKEVLRMSLKNYEEKENLEENSAVSQEDPTLSELKDEMQNIALMKAARAEEARQDKEVAILLTTVEKIGVMNQTFMESMLEKFDQLSVNQLYVLKAQNEYEKSVKDSISRIATNVYHDFRVEQEGAFAAIRKSFAEETDRMIKEANEAVQNAEKAAKTAADTADKIARTERWKMLLFYASPAAVIIYCIVRLLTLVLCS